MTLEKKEIYAITSQSRNLPYFSVMDSFLNKIFLGKLWSGENR